MKILPQISQKEIDYELPDERIAKYSLKQRDRSLLLVSDENGFRKAFFRDAGRFIDTGSMLVLNNAKVIHARMIFSRETGARIEVFLLEPVMPASYEQIFNETTSCTWRCMIGNARKWKGEQLTGGFYREGKKYTLVAERKGDNEVTLQWEGGFSFSQVISCYGKIPLPPYIKRETEDCDLSYYQTVFSSVPGSVAAPTAGLHFTREMMAEMKRNGYSFEELTLHVGAGTFLPVQSDSVTEHKMHREQMIVSRRFLEHIFAHEKKVTAVGTTSVRTMESLSAIAMQIQDNTNSAPHHFSVGQWETYNHGFNNRKEVCRIILDYFRKNRLDFLHAETSLMIVPGFRFLFTDALITNFHQPASTLLLLVSAFMGEKWKEMYHFALNNNFRFLSYGDACLIKPSPTSTL